MKFFKNYFKNYHKPGGIKELLILAFPMIISTACDGIMTFTDRLFLARIGVEQMNAAMGGGVTLQVIMFFFVGLTGYTTALTAQYFGANEYSKSTKAAFQAILVTLLAWPIVIGISPLAEFYFRFMNIPASQMNYQIEYLNILALGSLFGMMRYTLGCYFTGIGKTGIVMMATLAAMVVNVILDYILIFGKFGFAEMGVRGAAIATITGSFVAVIILAISYLGQDNRSRFHVMKSFRFDFTIMKKLLYYGYPAGLEMFLNFLAFSTMVSLFHSRGEVAATASTIMFNWDLVSFIPLLGIEIAVTSLVGRYMGAGNPDSAQRAAYSGIRIGIFYSIIILVLFLFSTHTLVYLFHPDKASAVFLSAVPIAVNMIRIAALYVLVEAVLVAVVGALRGAGDTHFTMIASVTAHWLFVPILYVSLNVLNLSIEVSWLFLVIFFLAFTAVFIRRFKSGKWKKINVIG